MPLEPCCHCRAERWRRAESAARLTAVCLPLRRTARSHAAAPRRAAPRRAIASTKKTAAHRMQLFPCTGCALAAPRFARRCECTRPLTFVACPPASGCTSASPAARARRGRPCSTLLRWRPPRACAPRAPCAALAPGSACRSGRAPALPSSAAAAAAAAASAAPAAALPWLRALTATAPFSARAHHAYTPLQAAGHAAQRQPALRLHHQARGRRPADCLLPHAPHHAQRAWPCARAYLCASLLTPPPRPPPSPPAGEEGQRLDPPRQVPHSLWRLLQLLRSAGRAGAEGAGAHACYRDAGALLVGLFHLRMGLLARRTRVQRQRQRRNGKELGAQSASQGSRFTPTGLKSEGRSCAPGHASLHPFPAASSQRPYWAPAGAGRR